MNTIEQAVAAHSSFEYLGTQQDGAHVVACNCHNPDENGDGRQDFSGSTFAEALEAWLDHVLRVVDEAMTAESIAAEQALAGIMSATLPAELAGRVLADCPGISEAWLAARSRAIGGSDAAKFSKPESAALYLRAKLHSPFDGNAYTRHGNDRERRMLAAYGIEQNTLLLHAEGNRRHVATPDGIIPPLAGLPLTLAQAKTFNHPIKAIAPQYRRQMWWEQYVTGAERTLFLWEQHENFTPLSFEPESMWLDRDDDEIEKLVEIANIILGGMDAADRFKRELDR